MKKIILSGFLIVSVSFAAPAFNRVVQINNNGVLLEVSPYGNEYFNAFKTQDGVLLKKKDGKFYKFNIKNNQVIFATTPYDPFNDNFVVDKKELLNKIDKIQRNKQEEHFYKRAIGIGHID